MAELTITDLVVEYSSGGYAVRPIDGLSLTAKPGTLNLLLGPSGCGKTSLLSSFGGILSPKSGSIRLDDVEITSLRGSALTEFRRNSVGIVFQAFNLVPSLTALENVALPMRAAGQSWGAARTRAGELLDRVGLAQFVQRRPGAMSGGQQQRVAIARALALDPSMFLADEPTAHLDYVQVDEVLRLLRELATDGRVVIVATHDQRLLPLADQVIELVPQAAVSDRPPEQQELAAGEVLFRQGSWGDLVYVIEAGEIEIVAELADGSEEHRAVLGAGKYFGEIGPLCQMPRSATARAKTPARVVGYSARDFRERLGLAPLPTSPPARRRREPLRAR